MIVSQPHVIDYIKNWIFGIKQYQNKEGIIVPMTGGIDSIVCGSLCLGIKPSCPVYFVCMGFKKDNEKIFEEWVIRNFSNYRFIKPIHVNLDIEGDVSLGLLNAYITVIGNDKNLLKVGKINRSESIYIKSDVVDFYDCYPLSDLYKSEILSIFKYLELPEIDFGSLVENDLGISYNELEWLSREDEKINIITSDNVPSSSKFWGLYTIRQKEIIGKVYSLNKKNRGFELSEKKQCHVRKALLGLVA